MTYAGGVRQAANPGDALTRRRSGALRRILAIPFWPIRRLLWPQFAWVRATVVQAENHLAARTDALERQLESVQERLAELEISVVESMTLAGGELRATGDAIAALAETRRDGGLTPAVAAYVGRALGSLEAGDRVAVTGGVPDDLASALAGLGLRAEDAASRGCGGAVVAVSALGSQNGVGAAALDGLRRAGAAVRAGGTIVVIAVDTAPDAAARALEAWEVADLSTVREDDAPVLATLRVTREVAPA